MQLLSGVCDYNSCSYVMLKVVSVFPLEMDGHYTILGAIFIVRGDFYSCTFFSQVLLFLFFFLGKFFNSSFQVGGLSHSGSVRIKSFSVVVFQSKGKINLTWH